LNSSSWFDFIQCVTCSWKTSTNCPTNIKNIGVILLNLKNEYINDNNYGCLSRYLFSTRHISVYNSVRRLWWQSINKIER
jgi:hypothetical protein